MYPGTLKFVVVGLEVDGNMEIWFSALVQTLYLKAKILELDRAEQLTRFFI